MIKWTDKCLSDIHKTITAAIEENDKQIKKWGIQTFHPAEWMMFLTEEVGEVAQAVNEHVYRGGDAKDIFEEAIQVATLALKIAEMAKAKD